METLPELIDPALFCPNCGLPEVQSVLTPDGPHYAKAVCGRCGQFVRWVAAPKLHWSELVLPEGPPDNTNLPALLGTTKQIEWAETIRRGLLPMFARTAPANLIAAMRTITDASWWIANRGAIQINSVKWPRTWARRQD